MADDPAPVKRRRGRPKGSKNRPKVKADPVPDLAPVYIPEQVEAESDEAEPSLAEQIASIQIAPQGLLSFTQRIYKEFPDFMRDIWRHSIAGAPNPTPIQKDMADFLQHGPKRRIVIGFRGVAKSYAGGAYFAWLLLHDPEERMKYLSGSDDKVAQFSNWTKGLFRLPTFPVLRHLIAKKGQKDDQYEWSVGPASLQQYNTFSGSTANSAIQGGRATIGMLDDCEQSSNSDTELRRTKLLKNMLDVGNMLIPESRSEVVGFGTYQSLSSVYITMIRERGYEPFFIPARVPSKPKDYRGKLAPTIEKMAATPALVNTSTEPTRFTEEILKGHEKESGQLGWQLQWMVSDQHGDRFEHPFPLDRLIVWDGVNPHGAPTKIQQGTGERDKIVDLPCVGLPGDGFYKPSFVNFIAERPGEQGMIPYSTILMSVDPSGSGNKDEAAWAIMGAVPGQVHLIDFGGKKNGVDPKTMKEIALAAKKWQVREIVYENNMQAWGSLFEATLKEVGQFCKIEGVRANAVKEKRIVDTLEPILYGGQLIVSRKALQDEYDQGMRSGDPRWQERLLQYQMALFRRSVKGGGLEFDDRIDALAFGLAQLHERFLRTGTDAVAQAERDRREREAEGLWMEDTWGGSVEEPLWVNSRR